MNNGFKEKLNWRINKMNHKNLKSRRESKYKRIIRKERIKMERKLKKKQNIQRCISSFLGSSDEFGVRNVHQLLIAVSLRLLP